MLRTNCCCLSRRPVFSFLRNEVYPSFPSLPGLWPIVISKRNEVQRHTIVTTRLIRTAKDYTSTWHVLRKKNSLLNRANLRNNEEDVKFFVVNTVAFIKCVPTLTSLPATSYQCFLSQPLLQIANFDSEKTHEEYIFERLDILHFCSEISQDYENAKKNQVR